MTPVEVHQKVKERFGEATESFNEKALDPYIVVKPNAIVEVCRFLKEDPALAFDCLSNMSGVDYLKEMEKTIRKLSYRHSVYTIFDDFIAMSAIAISNAVDWTQKDEREAQYMKIVKRYTKEEVNEFPKLLAMLTCQLEKGWQDALGTLYMTLEIQNQYKGQFFTPYTISQFMAKMGMGTELVPQVKEQGFITMMEPCCGAGTMAIAVAEEFENLGVNVHTQLHITAVDLDPTCALTTYLQLSLFGVPARVIHGNSLTLDTYSVWYTPIHVLNGWTFKLRRREQQPPAAIIEVARPVEAPIPEGARRMTIQLSLFD